MPNCLIHNATLGRLIRKGGWADLAKGTPRLIVRAQAAQDSATAQAPTAFLQTDWARYITGTTLHVNGGQLMD
jgi:NAD(P)-dependent dehydrogenase (short-subunit alcohol dehydrogenase family)